MPEHLNDTIPQPCTVSGVRAVRLDPETQDCFQREQLPAPLTELGFIADGSRQQWQYDREKVLTWFLTQLRGVDYDWVQDPWRMQETTQQPTEPHEAGPRPRPQPPEHNRPTFDEKNRTWRLPK